MNVLPLGSRRDKDWVVHTCYDVSQDGKVTPLAPPHSHRSTLLPFLLEPPFLHLLDDVHMKY